jgi:VanZ family protein
LKGNTAILWFWATLIGGVTLGSLLPASSPVLAAVSRWQILDKELHFGAYLALSVLPVIGIRRRSGGIAAGLSMFALGLILEGGQQFVPGRAVELADILANGAGAGCGTLMGLLMRTRMGFP